MLRNDNKGLIITTAFFLLISLFLRLYKINSHFTFAYDQGRDAFAVLNILKGKLTMIGPTTGIPGFFLGPFYYYFITPSYWLGQGNPVFPIIFLILFSLLGMLICCWIVKGKNNWLAFFLCLILLTFNFSHIKHSRWLSNPNPILFFSPLYFFLLLTLLKERKLRSGRWALLGFLLGLLFQTQLVNALFFLPITFFIFIIRRKRPVFQQAGSFVLSFIFTLVPLIFFNLRHDFVMWASLRAHFLDRSKKVSLLEVIKTRPRFYYQILTFFTSPKAGWLFIACLLFIIIYLCYKKFWRDDLLTILSLWFFLPLLFLLLYQSNKGLIWDYYLISQPLPFIMLLSITLSGLVKGLKQQGEIIAKGGILVLLGVFCYLNFNEWLILHSDGANKTSFGKMKQAIEYVYQEANGRFFNVEIFVPNFLPSAYEYLLFLYGQKKSGYIPKLGEQQPLLFYIMEPGQKYHKGEQKWRDLWYKEREHVGKIVGKYRIGEIDIEVRER